MRERPETRSDLRPVGRPSRPFPLRPRALLVVLALAVVVALVTTCASASAGGGLRALGVHVVAPVREQEPRAVVAIRARVSDGARAVGGASCAFVWRQGTRVVRRSSAVTPASGVAVDRAAVSGVEPDVPVSVTVLCRWRGQTARAATWFVQRPPLPAVPRIVFVGDSLTVGFYATTEAATFRSILAAAVPCSTEVIAAVGGRSDGVDLASVTAAAGDVYVVELGTNDASGFPTGVPVRPAAFSARLRAVAAAARAGDPGCRLVFLTTWQNPRRRRPYDACIAAVAADYGDHVVDISRVKDDPVDSRPAGVSTPWGPSDGWHPNDAGHAAIAADLVRVVRRILRLGSAGAGTGDVAGGTKHPSPLRAATVP